MTDFFTEVELPVDINGSNFSKLGKGSTNNFVYTTAWS